MPREFRALPFDDGSVADLKPVDAATLCVVHATKHEPKTDIYNTAYLFTPSHHTDNVNSRNTLHFTLNHKVEGHMWNSWDEAAYTIIGDFNEVRRHNGNPIGFNTVDTWWDRGPAESLYIPDAMVVCPANSSKVPLVRIVNDNRFEYKSNNYNIEDAGYLHKSLLLSYPEINHDEMEKVKNLATSPSMLALPENQNFIRAVTCKFAVGQAISHRGYRVMQGGKHGWGVCYTNRLHQALAPLRKELGDPSGQHWGSCYHDLERELAELRGACVMHKTGEPFDHLYDRQLLADDWIKRGFGGFDRYVEEYIQPLINKVSMRSQKVAKNCIMQIRHDFYDMLQEYSKANEEVRWQRLVEASHGLGHIR